MPDKSPKPAPARPLKIAVNQDKSAEAVVAETAHSPLVASAVTANHYTGVSFGDIELAESLRVLQEQAGKLNRGDLTDAETMLYGQASALNAIFNELARRALLNMGAHLGATESYMRLALKAQGQCRATLTALAEMKNPRPVAFVKQANIAHGPQQVNNGVPHASRNASPARAHASEIRNPPNELKELEHGQGMDAGTPGLAGRTLPRTATVGAFDRAED